MHPLRLLGTGLLKKNNVRNAKKAVSDENFLREFLGTHLIQAQVDNKF